ncbi:hypothetical protein CO989_09225 [Escherichia coli]|uniref:hypothetical protein n=1 Tax=Escherichia coli TaxID=562 RepID=UPI000BBCDDD6|nr:hypothetical protein [Escherichia coli]EKF4266805.1 hypothetical protein [Escherichia coli O113]EHL2715598.1 hypothetical protein [Escherichia coli]EKF4500931.1 hypothetical protein [Escherichia coli O113]PCG29761.1 hypothetical protein CO989_09225 [Escherichia coli]PCG50043.1 hypothetical protein CO991_09955 [Escherichia coli]
MNRELEVTVEDLSTIAEYMRGDDQDKPVVVDMKYLKGAFMTSSRLISLQVIMKARSESWREYKAKKNNAAN